MTDDRQKTTYDRQNSRITDRQTFFRLFTIKVNQNYIFEYNMYYLDSKNMYTGSHYIIYFYLLVLFFYLIIIYSFYGFFVVFLSVLVSLLSVSKFWCIWLPQRQNGLHSKFYRPHKGCNFFNIIIKLDIHISITKIHSQ